MIKNHKFLSLFAITLVAALLLSLSGKATSVYALAQLAPEVAPVFDTQIYQLQDYIDNGGMTGSQLDIFYTLAGFYVLGQAGNQGTHLVDPYANSSSVFDWLKSCGIELYNTLIGLAPDTVRLPDGSFVSTSIMKETLTYIVADLMGAAVKAATYETYEDFEDDIENSSSYYLPWNLDVQKGLNSIFGIYGGIYEWQFDSQPFKSDDTWLTRPMSNTTYTTYMGYLTQMNEPHVKVNVNSYSDVIFTGAWFQTYHNLFIDTTNNDIKFVDDNGQFASYASPITYLQVYDSNGSVYYNENSYQNFLTSVHFNPSSYNTYLDLAKAVFNHDIQMVSGPTERTYFYETWINHVYVGTNWLNKHELFNVTDLNLTDSDQEYYTSVPDDEDYLLDIKGILTDILNNTDLYNIFINNIFSPDGVLVHDTDLIRISTDIYDLLNQQNPPLPVNLNDISDYMDNTYLDLVKQHGENFGETIGEYVAFWHNADPELTYVIFGALILTLVGAFIGKWGHS